MTIVELRLAYGPKMTASRMSALLDALCTDQRIGRAGRGYSSKVWLPLEREESSAAQLPPPVKTRTASPLQTSLGTKVAGGESHPWTHEPKAPSSRPPNAAPLRRALEKSAQLAQEALDAYMASVVDAGVVVKLTLARDQARDLLPLYVELGRVR